MKGKYVKKKPEKGIFRSALDGGKLARHAFFIR